jgi:aerobic-type carbon monoxide dehydrogenase small subunit (CoxS/CutS family)
MDLSCRIVPTTGHRVAFECDGRPVEVEGAPGESLLTALRERLGITGVKDGCAPQGQCGCCTVLVDGDARVACVTPLERVAGRTVTTLAGLPTELRDRLVDAFVATGGSQCGFCTPGIMVRAASLLGKGRVGHTDVDRALAAHLCRCTGWQTVVEAIDDVVSPVVRVGSPRDLRAAARRATLEGGVGQAVGPAVPTGDAGFADDTAPRDALVAVPLAPGMDPDAAGAVAVGPHHWVLDETLAAARARAGKVQGRRSTVDDRPPVPLPDLPDGGVRLATSWVEPAYLEPDASWCEPGGEAASPLANGGAFGSKRRSLAPGVARILADGAGRSVRVVFAREDCVRLGPKRPPIAASAVWRDGAVQIKGHVANGAWAEDAAWPLAYALPLAVRWSPHPVTGPPVGRGRATGLAEQTALVEGAISAAGLDRVSLVADDRIGGVLLDTAARLPEGDACAGARVLLDDRGALTAVSVRVAAGDPLDEVVLRSYCIGAVHMALGWVLTEGLAVDPERGDVLDLTIRSFGVLRPKDTPTIDVEIVQDLGAPRGRSSDAVFAAVAAAAWNAIADATGERPKRFPTGVLPVREERT